MARRSRRSVQGLKRKCRNLETASGAVRVVSPNDTLSFDEIFRAFLDQRGARFRQMGVSNLFEDPAIRAFIEEVSAPKVRGERPFLQFSVLFSGDAICATYAGITAGNHYSCFANSIDEAGFGKFSPGEILLRAIIEDKCTIGLSSLDLGMGTERYKKSWCDEDPLFDCFVPVTTLGRMHRIKTRALLALKRRIRSDPRLWNLAKKARRVLRGSGR
ncbi:MAG: GNAT family N-acetyltransferase, partial [Pseudomonadota bacterium]